MVLKNKIVLTTLTLLISFTALAQTERGKASYYSKSWSGRKTANGERLHHDSLTCAHKTYPFGTLLKVTNPVNGLSVIVKVTDRGPYVKGRVVDLSVRAAKELGILAQGIAPVIVERYNPSIIPFKPEDFELPEFDLGTNEGSSAKPIWMELRDQRIKRRQEQAKLETEKKAMERRKIEIRDSIALRLANEDILDEINSKPNHSKAYLKRNKK
ncbi:MAG: septal ring lytic transglycosylase RlpA family protein [Prevotella sp.]|jgi:rare lipoprotein A|nr:septal ring lytic transglycosylase RlpA family protein [Prevotella sp.]